MSNTKIKHRLRTTAGTVLKTRKNAAQAEKKRNTKINIAWSYMLVTREKRGINWQYTEQSLDEELPRC